MPPPEAAGATARGTAAYRDRMVAGGVAPEHFRQLDGLWLSTLGLGTYLGGYDDATDDAYHDAIVRAVELGCNFLDTAVNYRCQRSERTIGRALKTVAERGLARRDELVVATKGGFIPYDGAPPADPGGWVRSYVTGRGLASRSEIVAGVHCMTPAFLRDQLRTSLANLGVAAVDVYYLHNPEAQLGEVDRREFLVRLQQAFTELEAAVADGSIRGYGLATWHGFRLAPEEPAYLSVEEVVRTARAALGGDGGHHLSAIQLPYNAAMHEALSFANQTVAGELKNTLDAATGRGLDVVASAGLRQGELAGGLPDALHTACPGLRTDAQRALQFARSTPGVTAVLAGMGRTGHVEENLELGRVAPAPGAAITALFE